MTSSAAIYLNAPGYPINDLMPFHEVSFIPIIKHTASNTVWTSCGGALYDLTSLIASLGILETADFASSNKGLTVDNSFSASSFC